MSEVKFTPEKIFERALYIACERIAYDYNANSRGSSLSTREFVKKYVTEAVNDLESAYSAICEFNEKYKKEELEDEED